jgi:hypothetical protein
VGTRPHTGGVILPRPLPANHSITKPKLMGQIIRWSAKLEGKGDIHANAMTRYSVTSLSAIDNVKNVSKHENKAKSYIRPSK